MSFHPAGAYQPPFWTVSSHDIRHVERLGVSTISANASWVANLAVYVPFTIDYPGTIYEWFALTGTLTTSHNWDFGIYKLDFTKIQSLGSTAGGTTASAINNTSTWTDLDISPGSYYMAFADDSTRNFLMSADALGLYQASGVMEQTASAFPLPSPMAPIVYARAFLPIFGFNMRTTAI